jgi:methyltransferase (TIGR00027 family)
MSLRTRFIDREVARAIGRGTEQIVIVGAGYDGRALRFGGGTTRWIEVDMPSTQADKRRRLAALGVTDAVSYAGVDLMVDNLDHALTAANHNSSEPSLFICEGLFAYLPREVNVSVCRVLRARAAEGSVLTFNVAERAATQDHALALRGAVDALLAAVGERRHTNFGPGDAELLATASGWKVVRKESSAPHRLDQGTRLLVLAAEPG